MSDPLIDFNVTYSPPEPIITVRATGVSDKAITLTVEHIQLDAVLLTGKSPLGIALQDLATVVAQLAAPIVKKKLVGSTHEISLDHPLGTEIPAGGGKVKLKLDKPTLGTHDGKLLISGEANVS